jgi:ribonuclease M5
MKLCKNGEVINVYLPSIKGKEKRKTKESAQGILGVEGTDDSIIIKALQKAGITGEKTTENTQKVSKTDFYNLGISGGENSKEKRGELCNFLKLPLCLTANALLDAVNTLYTYDEFFSEVEKWRQDKAQN